MADNIQDWDIVAPDGSLVTVKGRNQDEAWANYLQGMHDAVIEEQRQRSLPMRFLKSTDDAARLAAAGATWDTADTLIGKLGGDVTYKDAQGNPVTYPGADVERAKTAESWARAGKAGYIPFGLGAVGTGRWIPSVAGAVADTFGGPSIVRGLVGTGVSALEGAGLNTAAGAFRGDPLPESALEGAFGGGVGHAVIGTGKAALRGGKYGYDLLKRLFGGGREPPPSEPPPTVPPPPSKEEAAPPGPKPPEGAVKPHVVVTPGALPPPPPVAPAAAADWAAAKAAAEAAPPVVPPVPPEPVVPPAPVVPPVAAPVVPPVAPELPGVTLTAKPPQMGGGLPVGVPPFRRVIQPQMGGGGSPPQMGGAKPPRPDIEKQLKLTPAERKAQADAILAKKGIGVKKPKAPLAPPEPEATTAAPAPEAPATPPRKVRLSAQTPADTEVASARRALAQKLAAKRKAAPPPVEDTPSTAAPKKPKSLLEQDLTESLKETPAEKTARLRAARLAAEAAGTLPKEPAPISVAAEGPAIKPASPLSKTPEEVLSADKARRKAEEKAASDAEKAAKAQSALDRQAKRTAAGTPVPPVQAAKKPPAVPKGTPASARSAPPEGVLAPTNAEKVAADAAAGKAAAAKLTPEQIVAKRDAAKAQKEADRQAKMVQAAADRAAKQANKIATRDAMMKQKAAAKAQKAAEEPPNYNTMTKQEMLDEAHARARRHASSASGQGYDAAIGTELTRIANNPKWRSKFTPAELKKMDEVIAGDPATKLGRHGRSLPLPGSSFVAGSGGAAMLAMHMNPWLAGLTTVGVPSLGILGRAAANAGAKRAFGELRRMVRGIGERKQLLTPGQIRDIQNVLRQMGVRETKPAFGRYDVGSPPP